MGKLNVTEQFAEFVQKTKFSDFPNEVVEQIKEVKPKSLLKRNTPLQCYLLRNN